MHVMVIKIDDVEYVLDMAHVTIGQAIESVNYEVVEYRLARPSDTVIALEEDIKMLELTKGERTLLNHLLKEHNDDVKGLIKKTTSITDKEELTLELDTVESILIKINPTEVL